ncbi:MAG: T9SS type A sorting domain-containing protein [Calditrichaeota bacterium]|nr:T9SS type A sorting domain-containing protein [Calditrichota bacterium]
MTPNSSDQKKHWFKFPGWGIAGFIVLIGSVVLQNSTLQAADRSVEASILFQQEDSTFRTVFNPDSSPGKGKGWKPFNRFEWFYGQRLTPGVDVDPMAMRMQAWQNRTASRTPNRTLDENWSNIGPTNYSGRVLSIAWNPSNTNIIYVGSASGGLWKTTNGGSSWAPLTDDLPSLAIGAVALDPTNPNIVYIGTGEGSFNVDAVYGAGVFKSTDGGTTWSATGLSWTLSQNRAINKIVIDPTNTQIIYAACNSSIGGIYKSTNGGTSWTHYHSGDVKDLEMHPDSSNVLYAANGYPWGTTSNGIYKSVDSGVTWTQLTSGLPSGSSIGRIDLSICESTPTTIYAGVSQTISAGAALYGIYRSTNGGASWSLQATSPNMYSGQGWYNLVVQAHPTDANQVWSNGLDAYNSTNGGVSWNRMTVWSYSESHSQYAHADHHAMAYMPGNPNTILLGTDGGLFKSTNGGTSWSGLNNGLVTYQYYAICNDNLQPNVAYGGTQDNGTNKYNNSQTHTRVLGGDGGYCNVDYTNSNNVYATTQRGSHYKSTNGGSSFGSIQNGISGSGAWVTPRVMDPTNPNILYTGTNVVYKTTNGGASWTAISSVLDASYISHIAVAPSDPNTIYVCYEGYDGKVFRTYDGGTNWTNVESGIPERYPTHLAVDPTNRDIVYCTVSGYGSGHVYKSTNGGGSWSNSSTGLPDLPTNCIVIDQSDGNKMYAGNDLGVYYSSNAGASWSDFSTGLPNVVVDFLALHPSTGTLRAGTHGRGMWETATSAPSLTVQSPNGGESWSTGVANTITWGTGGLGGNVAIEINRAYPTGSWETIAGSTSNDGSYSWTVLGPATTTARVRVRHLTETTVADTSNANFTIATPSITVISPNGGEDWTVGSQHTIRWTKSGNVGNVQVRIKRDFPNGVWEYITLTSDTFYNWTVTSPTETNCRIYVYQDGNTSVSDTSNSDFTISGPWLTVDQPNGNEILTPGQSYTIRWTKHNFSGPCRVEINKSYPSATWTTLAASVAPDSLVWNVDQVGSTTARIRVTSTDYSTASDTSNANFAISYPFLQVTSPNTAVTWLTGTTQTISWSASNIVGNYNIYVNRSYSTGEWELLAINIAGSSWQWVVSGATSSAARIRVIPVNLPSYYDDSNTNFTIGDGAPGITVTAPNGGETWQVGTSQTITWSRNFADGAATISINRNYPSGTWETISSSNTGNSQGWTVTAPVTSNARIRVTLNSNGAITDASNAPFNIVQPSLTLSVPNGGESYTVGTTVPVTFTRNNATGNVTVQLMRSYPSGSWETLSTSVSTSSFNWTATSPGTSTARMRIYLTGDGSVGDTSAANFTIVQPTITLLSPNGGEAWNVGTSQTVRWSRQSASGNVRIMLNRDYPAGSWEQLASSVTVDTFQWAVSGATSNAARVRVYLESDPTIADTSASNFAINNPALTLTAPDGGESLLLGSPTTIRWTRNNAPGNVTVQFKRSYPSGTWEQLANNVAVDTFAWTPTGTTNGSTRVRVFLTTQPSVGDTSDANFSLVNPTITVTSPNGGEQWPIGTQQVIRFARLFAPGNATIQVNRSNGSGTWETLTSSCAADTFVWSVSGAASSTALVRVRLTSDTTVTDNSNAVFSIIQPSLTVTAPNGGEQITLGGSTTIRFTRNFANGAATIKLNRSYPGGTWETLTTSCTADTFAWTASGAASTTARVSVELTGGGATADESNANFSLVQRTLALTSHNGGTYYVGTTSPITFTRSNADGNVTIELNRSYPTGNWEILAANVTGNSFNWSVTDPVSSTARVRLTHQTWPWVSDVSDANFAIENASLSLVAPTAGAVWAIGSQQNVAWTKSGTSSPVRVDFMRTYPGGAWETLSASETDTVFTWTVTGPVSTTARFRVVATANEALSDTSDAVEIAQPTLTINSPADGSTLLIGFPITFAWTRYLAPGTATVQLNRNYPSGAWETLGTTGTDTLLWTVNGAATTNARFRVVTSGTPSVGDTTLNLSIALPSITLTYPNGGEQLRQTTSTVVTWTRSNLSGGVRLELNSSYPSGAWTTLASGLVGNNYTWNITEAPTTTARLRVIFEDVPSYADTSNANFTIFRPELTLVSPTGGEQWVTGTSYTIELARVDHAQPATIKLNRNYPNGAWETVAGNVTGNTVNWTAAGTVSTNARLRVESSLYSNVGDTMAASFSIVNPGVTLVEPNGGETYAVGSSQVIRFQRIQVSAVNVYVNHSYPSGTWEPLANNLSADSLVWTVTSPLSTLCRVKVENSSNTTQNDISAANFAIQSPSLILTSPVPGDTFAIGVPNTIAFTRNASANGNVRVDVNTNYPSGSWQQVGITTANDVLWTPAGPPNTTTRVRVMHTSIPNLGDTLDFNIPVDFSSLVLTSPSQPDSYQVGDVMSLSWTRTHVGLGANLYINRTYPAGAWELIAGNLQTDSYDWTVTGPRSPSAVLRVLSSRNLSLGDSTPTQSILVPAIALTSMNSGTYGLGNTETITFTKTDFASTVAIDVNYTYPAGSWQSVATGVTGTSYDWLVSGSASSTTRLRVRSEEFGVIDVADNNISLVTPTISITTLNTTQLFTFGDQAQIIWSKTAAPGGVNVELNRDYPGGTWESLATDITQNSYTWTVNSPGFAHGRVRVSMTNRSDINDVNDADFGTFLPALQVLAPNGGDTLILGEQYTMQWSRNGATGSARVQLNRDWPNGTWETLLAQTSGNTYTWTISGNATTNARIRVQMVFDTEVYDISDESFAILPESVVLLEPQTGDSVAIGDTVRFCWRRVGLDPGVTVYVKRNYPSGQWAVVANAVQADTFLWVATGDPAPNAHFRILSSWNTQLGDTAGPCPIGAPVLTITEPEHTDTMIVGATQTISWSRAFADGDVNLEISRSGATGPWSQIAEVEGSSYDWVVTEPVTTTARFRVSIVNKSWVQGATGFNSIIAMPRLDLESPPPGDTLALGRTIVVAWSRQHVDAPVNVLIDRGTPASDVDVIRENVAGDSIHWVVTPPLTQNSRIVVRTVNGVFVETDGDTSFVVADPVVRVSVPDGGDEWIVGHDVEINWSRAAVEDPVRVELNRDYPNGSWELLAESVAGTSMSWMVTGNATGNARIRVTSTIDEDLDDVSDAPFSIALPTLNFTSEFPERIPLGFARSITWEAADLPGTVTLYLSRDNGATYSEVLASSMTVSQYTWLPTGSVAAQAKLKIQSDLLPAVYAVSSPFVLAQPTLTVTYPQNGESITIGNPVTLRWTRADHPAAVRVELDRNYPSGWEILASSVNADSFVWTPSGSETNSARLRVISTVNSAWTDIGDHDFAMINAELQILTPGANAELVLGSPVWISWTRTGWTGDVSVTLNRVGAPSTVISEATSADTISWMVGGDTAENSWLVVRSLTHPNRVDSVALMGPFEPLLAITNPVDLARWVLNEQQTVRWTREHLPEDVHVYLSDGGDFMLLGTSTADTFSFVPTGNESAQARVMIRSEMRTDVTDTSGTFRLVSPSLAMNDVLETEWRVGEGPITFSWEAHEIIGPMVLEMSYSGLEGPWQQLYSGIENSFQWWANLPESDNVRISVRSELEPQYSDTSEQVFTVYQPVLNVTRAPVADELFVGESVQLEISGMHVHQQVLVSLVRDGQEEVLGESNVPNDYLYILTGPEADEATFRVYVPGDEDLDATTEPFALHMPTVLWTSAPEEVFAGEATMLEWNVQGIQNALELVKLDDSGETVIVQNLLEESWVWNVNEPRGEARLILRVMDAPEFADTTNVFTVRVPEISWAAPTETGVDTSGQTLLLEWSALDGASPVLLDVSFDGGAWETIASTLVDTTYLYSLPYQSAETMQFRVTSADHPSHSATSPMRTLVQRALTITVDDAETVWYVGEEHWIYWSRDLAPGEVLVDVNYGDRAEENWVDVAASELDSFLWTVEGPETEFGALRVRLSGEPAVFDTTDLPISIRMPELTVIEPNGGESIDVTQNIRIRWSSVGVQGNVHVGLWRGAPVNQLDTLFYSTENDDDVEWTVTGPASDSCYIVIVSEADTSIHDVSDAPFRITGGTAADPRNSGVPTKLAMGLPYPNPFNATLTVPFEVPQLTKVKITVFDVLGREVAQLLDDTKPAGFLRVSWDATRMSSGLYFVRMQANDFSDVRRVNLLK